MRGSGLKKAHQESGKSRLFKKESGSKRGKSSQIVKNSPIPLSNKLKQKLKCHVKTDGSNLPNGKVSSSLGKTIREEFANRKAVKSMQSKALGSKVSKKQPSLRLQGEKMFSNSSKENGENDDEDPNIQTLKRKKQKRQKRKVEQDESSRLQRRSRYLLIKMKLEQNLIDAYSGEGWKGHSREKIKPEKELQRAKKQILKCKLGIRDAIRQLESLSSVGCIEDSVVAPDGSVHHEHIICAKCKLREAFPDNDIILCDGTCNCAFHQKCLDPPLATENIPPGDQGWLCRFCECKMEILEAMNAHLGTHFSVNSSWQDIFKEEAAMPDGGVAFSTMEVDWPSDDSEDDDYDPEKNENSYNISNADTEGSDDSTTSSSLSWSFDGEDLSGSGRLEKRAEVSENNCIYLTDSLDSDETNDPEIMIGRRKRRAVDYKKLYDEMFGKDAPGSEQQSEDDDWDPAKRKRREKESDAASTLMTLCESEKKFSDVEITEGERKIPPEPHMKRPVFRIPFSAVQKLRQVFAENELPSRAVKESLSKQLGLDSEKVSKWFKNARYVALKTRKNRSDLEDSRDTSKATLVPTPKNLKEVRRKKKGRSSISPSRKQQITTTSNGSPYPNKKVIMEWSDDVSLRKQMQLIRSKCKREKKVKFKPGGGAQAAEIQMDRLCTVMGRIENMKQVLSGIKNKKHDSNKAELHEPSIIYVPIAELREKL